MAKVKTNTADTRCETDTFVTRRALKGRRIVGILMRICGRVRTRVEACRIARSGCGNILALPCAEDTEKGAELKNPSGKIRAKEVIADTTRSVLND